MTDIDDDPYEHPEVENPVLVARAGLVALMQELKGYPPKRLAEEAWKYMSDYHHRAIIAPRPNSLTLRLKFTPGEVLCVVKCVHCMLACMASTPRRARRMVREHMKRDHDLARRRLRRLQA